MSKYNLIDQVKNKFKPLPKFNLEAPMKVDTISRINAVYLQTLKPSEAKSITMNLLDALKEFVLVKQKVNDSEEDPRDKKISLGIELLNLQYPGIKKNIDEYNLDDRSNIFNFSDDPNDSLATSQIYNTIIHPSNCTFRICFSSSFIDPLNNTNHGIEYVPNQAPPNGYYNYPLTDLNNYTVASPFTRQHTGLIKVKNRYYVVENYSCIAIKDSKARPKALPYPMYLPIGDGKYYGKNTLSKFPIHIRDLSPYCRIFLSDCLFIDIRNKCYRKVKINDTNGTSNNALNPYITSPNFPGNIPSSLWSHPDVFLSVLNMKTVDWGSSDYKDLKYFVIRPASLFTISSFISIYSVGDPGIYNQNNYINFLVKNFNLPTPNIPGDYPYIQNPNNTGIEYTFMDFFSLHSYIRTVNITKDELVIIPTFNQVPYGNYLYSDSTIAAFPP